VAAHRRRRLLASHADVGADGDHDRGEERRVGAGRRRRRPRLLRLRSPWLRPVETHEAGEDQGEDAEEQEDDPHPVPGEPEPDEQVLHG